jgi:arginyl-tRNA synthetase
VIPSPLAELAAPLAEAVSAIGGDGAAVRLERPADASHGDYASAVALGLAKPLRAAPRDIAARLSERTASAWIDQVSIAGPGFINLRVTDGWYRHVVDRILADGAGYGAGAAAAALKIQVEYVSGNPTGPVTASTARNAAYGDSLARLFAFAGHAVHREYYFNDAGRQMDLFGASLRARARGEEIPKEGYQGAYLEEIAADLGLGSGATVDEWRVAGAAAMVADIKRTLGRFRAQFDSWFLERSLYEDGSVGRAIERVEAAGHTYTQDGAVWLRSTDFGDDKDRVIIRSDGSPTYIAGDLAYMVSKLERGFDVAVYVLGADHHGYIGRLKAAAAALGYDPARIDIQIYQFVKILEDGRLVKVSKRRGSVLMLDELLDAIGVDATRYALVQRSHDQVIELDLDLWAAQNSENPVYYCQYAHARIAAILRGADDQVPADVDPGWMPQPAEAELVKALAEFPDLVAEAAERRGPHRIAGYAQDTAKAFHQFYKQCRVLGEEPAVERSRLALCRATMRVIATALDLIGVEAPDAM